MASLFYQKLENYLNSIAGYTPVSVTGVSIDSTEITLETGNSQLLTAIVEPPDATDKRVTWESSNTDVATVSLKGSVKAIGPGAATITVSTNDGMFTDSCTVNVHQAIGISSRMSEQGIRVYPDQAIRITGTMLYTTGDIKACMEVKSIKHETASSISQSLILWPIITSPGLPLHRGR